MMYPYMTLADETEIVHSQIIEKNGMRKIIVNFERPTEDGFDSARLNYPIINGQRDRGILMQK